MLNPFVLSVAEDGVSFVEALDQQLAFSSRRGVLRRIVEGEAERLSMTVKVAYELHSIAAMKTWFGQATPPPSRPTILR